MGYKEHINGKPASQQKTDTSSNKSIWERLSENLPRLFLYQKICVFLVAFLVFANGISNDFNIDDIYYTTNSNPIAEMGVKAIPRIFTTHTLYDATKNNFDYRPVTMLSFALQHQFLGSSPHISHFINTLIYALICLLVFLLLCHWFGAEKSWFAFFITLLYAVHPLHTEVVDSIKNRDELLANLFVLLSMISVWKWHKTGKTLHIVLCALLFITALLCKRTIIPYILVIPVAFYFFTNMPLKKLILSFTFFAVPLLIVSTLQDHFLPEQKRVFLFIENPMYVTHLPLAIKTATASYVLGWYSYLHIIPYPLSFYYGYAYVRLMNWGNMLPVISFVVYAMLAFLALKNIRKKSIISFGALIYLICILPYSNLFGAAPGMMAERFTFASSIGYCIMLVSALYYLFKIIPGNFYFNKNSSYFFVAFLCIFICYAALSIARNKEWKNTWVLYNNDMQHLQKSAKANMLYGEEVLSKNGYWRQEFDHTTGAEKQLYRDSLLQYMDEEKQTFKRVLAIAPDYDKALNNLAVAYINDDSLREAKNCLQRSIALTQNSTENPATYYNLGIVYDNLSARNNNPNFIDSSIAQFKKAVSINPKYATAYQQLCLIYLKRKDTASAISILLSGATNIPEVSMMYMELAEVYLYKEDTAKAIYYYEKGAAVPHPSPELFQLLQNYYHSKNNIEKENYYKNKATTTNAGDNQGR